MPRPRESSLNELDRSMRLVRKLDQLTGGSKLTKSEIDLVYEVAFLSSYVAFEVFIERQLISLLVGKPYFRGRSVKRRIEIKSERVAREVVAGQNAFAKFLPVPELKKLAHIFFVDGVPFSSLDRTDEESLGRGQLLRNAIAHRSRSATALFERRVLSQISLRASQRTPSGYLRSQHSPNVSRLENEISEMARIVGKLS